MIRYVFFLLLWCCWIPFATCDALALKGYDVVTYFTESEPERGMREHSLDHKGKTWVFASEDNLEKFKKEPSKYKPQYDGWCAMAMSEGRFTEGLPRYYSVDGGKLYIFCSEGSLKQWELNPGLHIQRADKHWKKMANDL